MAPRVLRRLTWVATCCSFLLWGSTIHCAAFVVGPSLGAVASGGAGAAGAQRSGSGKRSRAMGSVASSGGGWCGAGRGISSSSRSSSIGGNSFSRCRSRGDSLVVWVDRRKSGGNGPDEERPLLNNEIDAQTVRVILGRPEGDEPLGIMDLRDALEAAMDRDVDLVMISPTADPPVVKIIDYGKFLFQSEKKKREQKKTNKANEIKEVKMSYKIDTHDYQVRLRSAQKFMSEGSRVKIIVSFRGREQEHMKLGKQLIDNLVRDCEGLGVAETAMPRREGNRLSLFMNPKQKQ